MNEFKGKKLMIFGGVAPLKEIILDCQAMGICVIITDINANAPARKYADEFWNLSVTDVDALYLKCKEARVDGIMNYCADLAQKPYQKLCEMLGFKCTVTREQIDIMTNKDHFVECCEQYGVGTIPQYTLDGNNELVDRENVEFPVMIKPVDSAASKGLIICEKEEDFKRCLDYALSYSMRKKVVVQKLMRAPETVVKYVACDGELFLTSMSDMHYCINEEGKRVYLGTQTYPSRFFDEYLRTTDKKVRNMLRSIGIQNGAMSMTGFYDNGVFRFFDPSLRMGGAQDWRMVKAACGLDISQMLTHFAMTGSMGSRDEISRIEKAFAAKASSLLYFDIRPGVIGKFEGVEKAAAIPCVYGYHQCHFVGDEIKSIGTANNVAIRFILSCRDNQELKETIVAVQASIRIEDTEEKNMVVSPFDSSVLA
ncbi:MAG: hypothetical protein CW338_11820 [Clostridiales bacterium]|nr:hypothetical protein [Clostridiales bacterium]